MLGSFLFSVYVKGTLMAHPPSPKSPFKIIVVTLVVFAFFLVIIDAAQNQPPNIMGGILIGGALVSFWFSILIDSLL